MDCFRRKYTCSWLTYRPIESVSNWVSWALERGVTASAVGIACGASWFHHPGVAVHRCFHGDVLLGTGRRFRHGF